ncbi:coenzyme F420 hydrogenase [Methanococcoides methylutens]|uniref:Coenzyme F420 hydrogenase n=1 Tax=Methanococcoides methylutens TaxID=2226 RepID=A0A099T577_METMT|nr:4Fe-4S binding protein [Methanococcoides methylutens]KGK99313.1 coenzyme F420 hydrogenase [Methanococcoides methylutens]
MQNMINKEQLKKDGFLPHRQDNLCSMRVGITGGYVEVAQLRALADAAEKYGQGHIHITSRQGIEVPFVNFENVEAAKEDMKNAAVRPGVAGRRVRAVVACQGNRVCNHGLIDCQNLAEKIDREHFGADVPYKFKIAITGCPAACLKPQENDLGIMGTVHPEWKTDTCTECGVCVKRCKADAITIDENSVHIDMDKCILCGECILACPKDAIVPSKTGYTIFAGEKVGRFPRDGTRIVEVFNEEEVYDIANRSIEYYRENGGKDERLGDVIDREGIENFRDAVLK